MNTTWCPNISSHMILWLSGEKYLMTQYYLTFDFVAKRKTIPPHDSILVLFDFAAIGNDCVHSIFSEVRILGKRICHI